MVLLHRLRPEAKGEREVITESVFSQNDFESWSRGRGTIVPFFEDLSRSSLLTCLTILKELAGPNNNLARHLVDPRTSNELIEFEGHPAVLLRASGGVSVKTEAIRPMLIEHGRHRDAAILSPARIAANIRAAGVEPVPVLPWVAQSLYSGFDITTMNYRNQMWELESNDIYLYSGLVGRKQMVFQSIHDVTEHAAGISAQGWDYAAPIAREIRAALDRYFGASPRGNIPSHVVPFAAGVFLDHLTQYSTYRSEGRVAVIRALLRELETLRIRPLDPWILTRLPLSLDALVELANEPGIEAHSARIDEVVQIFLQELYQGSLRVGGVGPVVHG